MPLITCPDCSHEISTSAEVCPHCGRPVAPRPAITTQRRGGKYEAAGFGLILLGLEPIPVGHQEPSLEPPYAPIGIGP
jgi:zinc-ribbon domain